LRDHHPDWEVHVSSRLDDPDYIWDAGLAHDLSKGMASWDQALHLGVSIRSFRAEALSEFIGHLVDNRPDHASEVYRTIADKYPIFLTRSLDDARSWLRTKARGSERYGLTASSGANRLRPDGIWIKTKIDGLPLPGRSKGPLQVLSINDLMSQPPQAWLVKGVIPRSGLGVIYGDSGAGKTFITLDLALSVARNVPWQGKRVKVPVGVLYVSAEGGSAMSARIRAYAKYHNLALDDLPFGIVPTSVNLRGEDATRVIDACQSMTERGCLIGLIIFDTLNRTMGGGDENSSKDMGEYLDAIGRISDQSGAFILVVHHSGKNKQMGARGHSSLRAAIDVEFEVMADGDQQVLTITKSRDGETGREFVYRREVVSLGVDEDLDVIDSCVAVPGDPGSRKSQKPKAHGKWQVMAYQAITTLGDGASRNAVLEKIGVMCSHVTRWKENALRGIQGCIDGGVFISRGELLFMN